MGTWEQPFQIIGQYKGRMTQIPETSGSCREKQKLICTTYGNKLFGTKNILDVASRVLKYQVAQPEQDNVELKVTTNLNPSHVF